MCLALGLTHALQVAAQSEVRLVRTPNRSEVWVVRDGRRHWVPDLATLTVRGYRWDDIELVAPSLLSRLPVGPADYDAPLVWDQTSGDVYVIVDGRLRHVPDVHTLESLGVGWGRVRATTSSDLRGAPLPHAVTGLPFPSLGGRPVRAALREPPAPPAQLSAALRLVERYPPTAAWPAFLRRFGVTLRFGAVSGGLASYSAAERTLTVGEQFAGASAAGLSTVLVHEAVHAIYDARGITGHSGRACIDEEAQAFGAQAAFWALHRPADLPLSASGALEAELDRVLSAARDDALVGTVITTWAYTLRCYFPGP